MPIPTLDFESYSEAGFIWNPPSDRKPLGHWTAPPGAIKKGLSSVGSAVYSEHPSTEVLTASYDLCDGRGIRRWRPGQRGASVVKVSQPHDVRIDRQTQWGNPFIIGRDGTREQVIAKHRAWIIKQPELMAKVRYLRGKRLGCHCAPEACHGDTLSELSALPVDLFDHVAAGRPLESHNAMFERLIWNNVCVPKYGWPPLRPHVQRCSMATAHVDQYPGALAALGDVLGLDTRKDKDGERLLKKFSVPRDPTKADPRTRIRPEDDPTDFERLCAYCDQDVRAEQSAADAMAPMSDAELGFWLIDQEVNARGLAIDRTGVRDCIAVLGQVLEQYGAECRAITGGIGPAQVEALRGWLSGAGVHLPSLDADTVAAALAVPAEGIEPFVTVEVADDAVGTFYPQVHAGRAAVTGNARRVLELRQLTGSASVKKLYAIENQCSADDRLRNLIVHHGARTGRPTGEGPQPLNLPKAGPKLVECGTCGRPHRDVPLCPWCGEIGTPGRRGSWRVEYVDHVLEIMALQSLAMVEQFFGDAMLAISGCLRGLFVAGPGNQLIASDYSSIEAVVAAMLAGEQWRIDAFIRGDPIYMVGASKITGTPLQAYLDYFEQHGEHHPDRQKIGKVSELACGFSGWVNSYKAFGSTEPDDVIKEQILAWRAASPAIVEMWGGQYRGLPWDRNKRAELYGLEGMAISAIQSPGVEFTYRDIRLQVVTGIDGAAFDEESDHWIDRNGLICGTPKDRLLITLPSGRQLTYHEPTLTGGQGWANDEMRISYMTWNSNPKYGPMGWSRMDTYGGRLFENVVQAVAHDIQRHGIILLRMHGYPLVLGVYDEDVVEVPIGFGSLEEVERLMSTMPPWAAGWPIRAAGGWAGRRYRKG